jgi:aspartyl-tRNA(Asn)/glutamyl-tRNA(Gln) amidotransferase subunit C
MSLTRQEVEKIALLARLRLPSDELDQLTVQLAQIVDYVEQLAELDVTDVEPMAHAIEQYNVFAEDNVEPALDRAAALANAPKHDGECYLVPAVLGE